MASTKDRFRAHRIYNTHNLLTRFAEPGRTDYACSYHPPMARAVQPPKTTVWAPDRVVDPAAHWSDYGAKAFTGRKDASMPAAIAWATQAFGITEWVPSPFNVSERIPATVLATAKQWLKQQEAGA